jgi:hypothetical protein
MKELLRGKGLIEVAEDNVYVTGVEGPLDEGWQEKVETFAARIRDAEAASSSASGMP